ncbi:putative vacuolar protein sorting-associated protein [Helianthus annuus]|nr:putative vacuolar protein sorting-associated protein [Helianthus annuus]
MNFSMFMVQVCFKYQALKEKRYQGLTAEMAWMIPSPDHFLFHLRKTLSRADVLRENTEAVFAACDAAHGRWAKQLGVCAILHPRLRLTDFLNIYNVSREFVTATEKFRSKW